MTGQGTPVLPDERPRERGRQGQQGRGQTALALTAAALVPALPPRPARRQAGPARP
jgi:hypothetical protein